MTAEAIKDRFNRVDEGMRVRVEKEKAVPFPQRY